jgi:hypothetical protein
MLISIAKAAALLGICRQTAYNYAASGSLPIVRLSNGCIRVHEERLVEMIDANTKGGIIPPAGGAEESACRTNEGTRRTGGSATKRQMDATLDGLLALPTTRQPRRSSNRPELTHGRKKSGA